MTVRRRKPNGEEITLTFSKKNVAAIVIAALFLSSGNPILQKAGSSLLGIASPVSNIEDIKSATATNTKQIEKLGAKVDALIVEVEQLRMNKDRTADN